MTRKIDYRLPQKLYGIFCRKIHSAELMPGEQLPTIREIASLYQVSLSTAAQAVKLLAENGYVESIRGSGSFVARGFPGAGEFAGAVAAARPEPPPGARDTIYFFFNPKDETQSRLRYYIELFCVLQFEASLCGLKAKSISLTSAGMLEQALRSAAVDGAALVFEQPEDHRSFPLELPLPSLLLSMDEIQPGSNVISPDNYRGGWECAAFLHRYGHSRLGFVTGFPRASVLLDQHFQERVAGFADYCVYRGLPPPALYRWDVRVENGRSEIAALLAAPHGTPTALGIGSLAMSEEMRRFACEEFGIGDLSKVFSFISFQERMIAPSHTDTAVASVPISVLARETVSLVRRLMIPDVAKRTYRLLISMDIKPGATVRQL
ncbi:MAG: GntR family transcriptional regulator [Lentisphaeria bacterium]|nr:GntR family transcriptional regulator [Lentisphaeria bacterium]